jgi:hypothetical protein
MCECAPAKFKMKHVKSHLPKVIDWKGKDGVKVLPQLDVRTSVLKKKALL